jgi:hypothetical protein
MENQKLIKSLKVIYNLAPHLSNTKKLSLIDYFKYKTGKVQLMFEGVCNPANVVIF